MKSLYRPTKPRYLHPLESPKALREEISENITDRGPLIKHEECNKKEITLIKRAALRRLLILNLNPFSQKGNYLSNDGNGSCRVREYI
jgi:hypothetical protein